MPEWAADVELDEAHVRSLLDAQFPDLALDDVRPFAQGWDNALWQVGEDLLFRFPRRAVAVPGVEREIRVLGEVARRVPLPVPVPTFIGRASAAFPWPFFGTRQVPGDEIARVGVADAPASPEFAGRLGAFLAALHTPEVGDALGSALPRDPMRRADATVRVPRTRDRLAQLAAIGLWQPPAAAERILAAAVSLGPAAPRAVVHGDLHVRHVLVDGVGHPSGVIDWGDCCLADPSVDLPLYWSLLDEAGRRAFRGAYGEAGLSSERLLRARVLALFLDASLALYAHDIADAALLRQTLANLERTLAD